MNSFNNTAPQFTEGCQTQYSKRYQKNILQDAQTFNHSPPVNRLTQRSDHNNSVPLCKNPYQKDFDNIPQFPIFTYENKVPEYKQFDTAQKQVMNNNQATLEKTRAYSQPREPQYTEKQRSISHNFNQSLDPQDSNNLKDYLTFTQTPYNVQRKIIRPNTGQNLRPPSKHKPNFGCQHCIDKQNANAVKEVEKLKKQNMQLKAELEREKNIQVTWLSKMRELRKREFGGQIDKCTRVNYNQQFQLELQQLECGIIDLKILTEDMKEQVKNQEIKNQKLIKQIIENNNNDEKLQQRYSKELEDLKQEHRQNKSNDLINLQKQNDFLFQELNSITEQCKNEQKESVKLIVRENEYLKNKLNEQAQQQQAQILAAQKLAQQQQAQPNAQQTKENQSNRKKYQESDLTLLQNELDFRLKEINLMNVEIAQLRQDNSKLEQQCRKYQQNTKN